MPALCTLAKYKSRNKSIAYFISTGFADKLHMNRQIQNHAESPQSTLNFVLLPLKHVKCVGKNTAWRSEGFLKNSQGQGFKE